MKPCWLFKGLHYTKSLQFVVIIVALVCTFSLICSKMVMLMVLSNLLKSWHCAYLHFTFNVAVTVAD